MLDDERERAHAARVELLRAVSMIHADPHRFISVAVAAADEDAAITDVCRVYGVNSLAAKAMLQTPFSRLTGTARERVAAEIMSLASDRSPEDP